MQNKSEEISQYFGISHDHITRRKSKQVSEALSVLMVENPRPEPAMVKIPLLLKAKYSMEEDEGNTKHDQITRRKSKQVSEALSVLMEENPCPEPAMIKVPPLLKSKHSMEEEEDNIYHAL